MLGGERILELVKKSGLIENFDKRCLGGAGYDLRIGKIYELRGGGYLGIEVRDMPSVEEIKFDEFTLNPYSYVLIESVEIVNMPSNLTARILPRSTIFRCGAHLITALVDPKYRGTLIMGLVNLGRAPFRIQRNARIAQIVFERVEGKTRAYNGRYQGGRVV